MVDEGAHCGTLIDNVPAWQWLVGEGLEILPPQTLGCMLDYIREIKISSEIVVAAASAAELKATLHSGPGLVSVLLDHRLDEVKITEEVIKAARGGYSMQSETLSILLERTGTVQDYRWIFCTAGRLS
jgi:hypothetical protein